MSKRGVGGGGLSPHAALRNWKVPLSRILCEAIEFAAEYDDTTPERWIEDVLTREAIHKKRPLAR